MGKKNDTAQELYRGVTVSGSLADTTSTVSGQSIAEPKGNVNGDTDRAIHKPAKSAGGYGGNVLIKETEPEDDADNPPNRDEIVTPSGSAGAAPETAPDVADNIP